MSFYRNLLVGFAVAAIAMPILAENNTSASQTNAAGTSTTQSQTANTIELSESGVTTTDTTGTTGTSATTDTNKSTVNSGEATKQDVATTSESKVDLNKATVKDLLTVKGLNATKAKAIVAYRKKHGDFKSTEELNQVKGFKKIKGDDLKKITDQLTI